MIDFLVFKHHFIGIIMKLSGTLYRYQKYGTHKKKKVKMCYWEFPVSASGANSSTQRLNKKKWDQLNGQSIFKDFKLLIY